MVLDSLDEPGRERPARDMVDTLTDLRRQHLPTDPPYANSLRAIR
jgi:hypothetical protein